MTKEKLTKEQRQEEKEWRAHDRRLRAEEKEIKAEEVQQRKNVKRELKILEFMKKHDVFNHHHDTQDSSMPSILRAIKSIKEAEYQTNTTHLDYNGYLWNYNGDTGNYMPKAQLNCLWRSSEFESIYDVPLDGSYVFYIYDSGMRGLGSFSHMSVKKADAVAKVPTVNPGGYPPVSIA